MDMHWDETLRTGDVSSIASSDEATRLPLPLGPGNMCEASAKDVLAVSTMCTRIGDVPSITSSESVPSPFGRASMCEVCGKHMGWICGLEGLGIRKHKHEARCRRRGEAAQEYSNNSEADTNCARRGCFSPMVWGRHFVSGQRSVRQCSSKPATSFGLNEIMSRNHKANAVQDEVLIPRSESTFNEMDGY